MDDLLRFVIRRLARDPARLFFPIILLSMIAPVVLAIKNPEDIAKDRLVVYMIAPMAAALVAFMLRFLSPTQRSDDEPVIEELSRLRSKFERELEIRRSISKEDEQTLVATLVERVKTQTAADVIADIRKEIAESDFSRLIEENAQGTLRRVYREIEALGRRGSLNLVLGVIMALSGVGLLAYMVLGSSDNQADLTSFLMAFLPRLSIVAIVELFSYFFLRLYKASLADIKYFQNEATNIESGLLALRVALKLQSAPEIKQAITALLAVDRNTPLTAGLTTREIEDAKMFKDPASVSIQSLIEIIKAVPHTKE